MLYVRICARWSCLVATASKEFGSWNQERVVEEVEVDRVRCSRCQVEAVEPIFLISFGVEKPGISGGSRKRPVFNPFTAMKFPHFVPPKATLAPPVADPNEPYDVVILPVGFVCPRPERVVTLITRLVLSPYSAGGAPAMTSIDWMESTGIWLEKVLLC